MADRDSEPLGVVAVGASAGGVEALTQFAQGLPADLPYAILIALHMPASAPSVLAKIIDRRSPLPTVAAVHGAPLKAGHIHVAVPDRHLLVHDHRVALSEGPTENAHRPAINALFRSVALTFGPRAISVILSGVLDDGVLGTKAIHDRGGVTVAQAPDDALFPAMPRNAIDAGVIDHQVAAADIGALLAKLAGRIIEEQEMEPDNNMQLENRIAMGAKFSTGSTPRTSDRHPASPARTATAPCRWSTTGVTAARSGTPGPPTHCSRPRTTRSKERCGWRCEVCRRRRDCRAGWRTPPAPGRSTGNTASRPTKQSGR